MNNPVYASANKNDKIQNTEVKIEEQKNNVVKLTSNPIYRLNDRRISNVEYSNIYDKAPNNRIIENQLYTYVEQTSEEEI
tara:strand:+ start:174 stop:413 length:240 start_codon:yes stop_codon:yes gene_type:complete